MPQQFDVAIVGARVAGSSLAIQLAQQGAKVILIDRALFPSDTVSTHVIYPATIERLARLGVLDGIMAHRPPPLYTAWHHQNRMFVAPHTPEHGRDWAICVRRSTLDGHLVERAEACGVTIDTAMTVTGLVGAGSPDDPVRGVTAYRDGVEHAIHADIVVGADGANSTVAKLVGAERERVMPTRTMLYYAYWTGVDGRNTQDFFFEPPWVCAHFPADDGHHVLTMNGPVELRRSIPDLEAFYLDKLASIPQLAGRLRHATKVSNVRGSPRLDGFYRRHTGPGWLLTGDAAHFKHPASAQGIGDALHAAEVIAAGIADGTWRSSYPEWREVTSRDLYAFCEFLADVPTDAGMRRVLDIAIQDPSAARAIVDIWSRTSAPWDAMARVPAMLEAAGPSPESVLAKYEGGSPLRLAS
ncbi:NAD(P)/FAD-dependent oxidoreductase [uncultured Methylobacterium sp.]|uniref:NAD(P)/FAD-dependent oxidoreductase n=1 Tax=uncultured Methylobacterium sp. TaxID=157278 RepID=UPI0035C9D4F1